jgi:hypothetical protein
MKVILPASGPLPGPSSPPAPWERNVSNRRTSTTPSRPAPTPCCSPSLADGETLERLRGIKLLQWVGGLDTIDLEAARELGIPVSNVVAANSVRWPVRDPRHHVCGRRFGDVMQLAHADKMPWPGAVARGMFQVRGRA